MLLMLLAAFGVAGRRAVGGGERRARAGGQGRGGAAGAGAAGGGQGVAQRDRVKQQMLEGESWVFQGFLNLISKKILCHLFSIFLHWRPASEAGWAESAVVDVVAAEVEMRHRHCVPPPPPPPPAAADVVAVAGSELALQQLVLTENLI
jgi:hypothetical protein